MTAPKPRGGRRTKGVGPRAGQVSGTVRALGERLRSHGRLPGGYFYAIDGWLHCRGCHSGVIASEGTVPEHGTPCPVAEEEAAK